MPERHAAFERDRFLLDTLAERRQHGDARRILLAERVGALQAVVGAGAAWLSSWRRGRGARGKRGNRL